jgi:hypothetical protein
MALLYSRAIQQRQLFSLETPIEERWRLTVETLEMALLYSRAIHHRCLSYIAESIETSLYRDSPLFERHRCISSTIVMLHFALYPI